LGYGKIENVSEAFRAEIVVCLQALQRAADLGMQRDIGNRCDYACANGAIWRF